MGNVKMTSKLHMIVNEINTILLLGCHHNEEEFVFVTYTIIQRITSSEMCSLHLTHPSAHTLRAVGSRRCGTRGAVGGSVHCSRVSPQSWTLEQALQSIVTIESL